MVQQRFAIPFYKRLLFPRVCIIRQLHCIILNYNVKNTQLPFFNSNCLISGILTQFAAATAQKGTNRPIKGGECLTNELSPRAVTNAPLVAATYDVAVKIYSQYLIREQYYAIPEYINDLLY